MGMYEQFFDLNQSGVPYSTEEEALVDIQALVDMYLNMAFYNRDLENERLDLRGVVITPQEFRAALTDWTLESRYGSQPEKYEYENAVRAEAAKGKLHLDSRMKDSRVRIHCLEEALGLTWPERFCFYLALMCEYNRKYERIFGYVQDNVAARQPTLGLGISLFLTGEEKGAHSGLLRHDSLLWTRLFGDRLPAEGESRLSRPMAVRENVYRYLNGEEWLWGWWKSFAVLEGEDGAGKIQPVLKISFPGLLEALDSQGEAGKYTLFEIVTTLALISRMTGAGIKITGPVNTQAHRQGRSLLAWMEEAGMGDVKVNGLGPCASRVDALYGWEDLILEDSQKELMRQICSQVRYKDKVKSWGFYSRSSYGNGVSAVFYGAPGTGKTMAAQVMGRELQMDVYKIDLSQLISKYIGETEKNLNQLFELAKEQNAILFFDEADGLFAKRSAVENSNDRYANMETGYLLQKFEEYDGIVILATNFIHNIDEAFKRRIRFFVRFTFPDKDIRLKLWKSMVPPMAQVDERLALEIYAARFELAGSDIRSVLTNAACIAASLDRGIKNDDIKKALRIHYLKLGRKLDDRELL